jgi:hypothetical protein
LTSRYKYVKIDIVVRCKSCAGVAQLVEQLICNQQVGGSSPSTSSTLSGRHIGEVSRVAKGGRL